MDDQRLRLQLEVQDLYADYADCIDSDEIERWPDFFTDDCLYQIISRENFDRGLPLAVMLCEGKGMLQDRVDAIRNTSVFAPRYLRHLVSHLRITPWEGDELAVRGNYVVLETLVDEATRVFNAGRYLDRLVRRDGALRFKRKIAVYDSVVIPNSLIYPI